MKTNTTVQHRCSIFNLTGDVTSVLFLILKSVNMSTELFVKNVYLYSVVYQLYHLKVQEYQEGFGKVLLKS